MNDSMVVASLAMWSAFKSKPTSPALVEMRKTGSWFAGSDGSRFPLSQRFSKTGFLTSLSRSSPRIVPVRTSTDLT